MNPAENVSSRIEELIQQNERLTNENTRLTIEQAKLAAKLDAIRGEVLRTKAINDISSKVNAVVVQQACEIHDLKEQVEFRSKLVAGCALASLACLAYVFAPVWVPVATAKIAWIKLSVLGLL